MKLNLRPNVVARALVLIPFTFLIFSTANAQSSRKELRQKIRLEKRECREEAKKQAFNAKKSVLARGTNSEDAKQTLFSKTSDLTKEERKAVLKKMRHACRDRFFAAKVAYKANPKKFGKRSRSAARTFSRNGQTDGGDGMQQILNSGLCDTAEVQVDVLATEFTLGSFGANLPIYASAELTMAPESDPEPRFMLFNGDNVNPPEDDGNGGSGSGHNDTISLPNGASVQIYGKGQRSLNNPDLFYEFGNELDPGQVIVIANQDHLPSILEPKGLTLEDTFGTQQSIGDVLEGYFDPITQIVTIPENQFIALFELGTTNPNSAAFDMQDLALTITAECPVETVVKDTLDSINYANVSPLGGLISEGASNQLDGRSFIGYNPTQAGCLAEVKVNFVAYGGGDVDNAPDFPDMFDMHVSQHPDFADADANQLRTDAFFDLNSQSTSIFDNPVGTTSAGDGFSAANVWQAVYDLRGLDLAVTPGQTNYLGLGTTGVAVGIDFGLIRSDDSGAVIGSEADYERAFFLPPGLNLLSDTFPDAIQNSIQITIGSCG